MWLARPTSRCILFDGENISFDASFFVYINSTNIPPIVTINKIYIYKSKSSVAVACFLPGWAKDLAASPVRTAYSIFTLMESGDVLPQYLQVSRIKVHDI